jgi:hypothetical protein
MDCERLAGTRHLSRSPPIADAHAHLIDFAVSYMTKELGSNAQKASSLGPANSEGVTAGFLYRWYRVFG